MSNWQSGYQKLIVWQEVRKFVTLIYKLTECFPQSEEFGLKSQLRRAAVSILANIAEGWLRKSSKDKIRFLEIAQGSLLEVETEGLVALDVHYWTEVQFQKFNDQKSRVSFLLFRYKSKIEESN
ncbi:four helix bundle protein [Candidatus Collierbacteria bacterium]|nr:four helix bundle protein [Candidatus Collierbacteria bacterium]